MRGGRKTTSPEPSKVWFAHRTNTHFEVKHKWMGLYWWCSWSQQSINALPLSKVKTGHHRPWTALCAVCVKNSYVKRSGLAQKNCVTVRAKITIWCELTHTEGAFFKCPRSLFDVSQLRIPTKCGSLLPSKRWANCAEHKLRGLRVDSLHRVGLSQGWNKGCSLF